MFNLFKNNSFPPEFKTLADSFKIEQKVSIIVGHFLLANLNGEIDSKEEKYIENIANMLHISLDNKAFTPPKNLDYINRQLSTLTNSQKVWYALSLFELIIATVSSKEKMRAASNSLLDIGFDERDVYRILTKVQNRIATNH